MDGNESAAQASARLASSVGSELRQVSAYGKFGVTRIEGDDELISSTVEEAQANTEQVAIRIYAVHPDVAIVSHAASGKPAVALLAVAAMVDAELIVVGNKRVQGASRILGSIATEVAREAPCDLCIAHTHARR